MTTLDLLFENYGQSPWIDNIRRDWLNDGTLAALVAQGVRGVTSNPAIFAKAFATSTAYDDALASISSHDAERVFETLAVADVQDACDVLRSVYDGSLDRNTSGRRYLDGFVSLEVSPRLAHDTQGTIAAAERLWNEVDRPNVMIKIPATIEGLDAVSAVLSRGININVTLIFSLERYQEVLDAWATGLKSAHEQGRDISTISSVASFFVSRVDAAVDELLPEDDERRGQVAIAQVAAAYEIYQQWMQSPQVVVLLESGAQVQRPLWASTSTKNPAYDPLLYVDSIVGDETVNTMPDTTLAATIEHGDFALSVLRDVGHTREAASTLEDLPDTVSLGDVTDKLERDGVTSFVNAYEELLELVATKIRPPTQEN